MFSPVSRESSVPLRVPPAVTRCVTAGDSVDEQLSLPTRGFDFLLSQFLCAIISKSFPACPRLSARKGSKCCYSESKIMECLSS